MPNPRAPKPLTLEQVKNDLQRSRKSPAGGAAFGITPMIGKRREDRQDREAAKSFPVDLARGVAAGFLGMPGDFESLARLPYELISGNESPTLLPTSEDMLKRMPFGTDTPAGQFASGLGSIAGGSANVGSVIRGAKAVPGALKEAKRSALDAGMKLERDMEPVVKRIMDRGGLGADILNDMAKGTRSQIFIGPKAKTFHQGRADMATAMEEAGRTPQEIWLATGTFRGADGILRQEIDDRAAKFLSSDERKERIDSAKGKIAEMKEKIKPTPQKDLFPKALTEAKKEVRDDISILKSDVKQRENNPRTQGLLAQHIFEHPELYAAYPELQNVKIVTEGGSGNTLGALSIMPSNGFYPGSMEMDIYDKGLRSNPTSTTLHEMQHAVQTLEGMGPGGNPTFAFSNPEAHEILKRRLDEIRSPGTFEEFQRANRFPEDKAREAYDEYVKTYKPFINPRIERDVQEAAAMEYYKRLLGEAEARAVQDRQLMTPSQRMETPPPASYDVPQEDLIVKPPREYADGGSVQFSDNPDTMALELAGGGLVKRGIKAIKGAAESAGQKAPVLAEKDLTTLQDFHTSLGDSVRQRVAEANKMMEGFDYKYDKGQRVFTKDSAAKNKPPYTILSRTRVGNQVMREDMNDLMSKKIIDPETGKAMRTPYEPGYRVRMERGPDDWHEFDVPASAIVGDVELAGGGLIKKGIKAAAKAVKSEVPKIAMEFGNDLPLNLNTSEVKNLARRFPEPVVDRVNMAHKDVLKRTPELQEAAARIESGDMSADEYARLVSRYKPVTPYESVPEPATTEQILAALSKTSREAEGLPRKETYFGKPSSTLKEGDPVGLRLDIPSYNQANTWVVTAHGPRKSPVSGGAGTRIGYEPVAMATDVDFSVSPKAALGIAKGAEKNTIATMEGKWKPTSPKEAYTLAQQYLKSPEWRQVGMDPERHSFFYDRQTMAPVVNAEEVIQIGPLVLAKNPKYGKPDDFKYADGGAVRMQAGGLVKGIKAAKAAVKTPQKATPIVEAPSIMVPSSLSQLKEAIRQSKGEYGARRVQRAADEIPNLERMYKEQALREAFGGDNAKALMTMNPADFERYAKQLEGRTPADIGPKMSELAKQGEIDKYTVPTDEYIQHLMRLQGGFDDVPYLNLYKDEVGLPSYPEIKGHEGRHRNRALAAQGEESSLVQISPRGDLREGLPRRSQEEFIEALKEELGRSDQLVYPEADPYRPPIRLPDPYAAGGAVKMAAGGLSKLAKLARAGAKSKQEIEAIAERMAPQVTGEYVRESAKSAKTVAGKTQKQFQREKNLPVDVRPTAEERTPQKVDIEKLKGNVMIGIPGDPTLSGQTLYGVGDVKLGSPSPQHGGPLYGLYNDENFWASGLGAARRVQNLAKEAGEQYDAPVAGKYIMMGPDSINYAQHFADANLQAIDLDKMTKKQIEQFNKLIRFGNPKSGPRPSFPGIEDKESAYLQMAIDPELRKHFNELMQKPTVTEALNQPSGTDIRFAITEPALRDLETGVTGFSMGRMRPEVSSKDLPLSTHPTYSHDIPGEFMGQSKYPMPYELSFPDTLKSIRENPAQAPHEFGSLKMVGPRQTIDQQMIDEIKMYEERMKALTGKKKGGAVRKYAAGGAITADDLILEERML